MAADWPAWVQAIGSIAAIAAGFGVAGWQNWQARQLALSDRREMRASLAELADRLLLEVETEARDLKTNPEFYYHDGGTAAAFELLATAVGRFDVTRLASADGTLAAIRMEGICRRARLLMDAVGAEWGSDSATSPDTRDAIDRWRVDAKEVQQQLGKLARQASWT